MKSYESIFNELELIRNNYNLEGDSLIILNRLLARSIYENQLNEVNDVLENSFFRSQNLNNKITHAYNSGYSVFRGKNQVIHFKNLTALTDINIKKFDVIGQYGNLKLVAANDIVFDKDTIDPDKGITNLIDVDAIVVNKDGIVSDTFNLSNNQLYVTSSHTDLSEDLIVKYIRAADGKSKYINITNNYRDRFEPTEDPIDFMWVQVLTYKDYSVRIINNHVSTESPYYMVGLNFNDNDLLSVKYLKYTNEEIDISKIKYVTGFDMNKMTTITSESHIPSESDLLSIYINSIQAHIKSIYQPDNSEFKDLVMDIYKDYFINCNVVKDNYQVLGFLFTTPDFPCIFKLDGILYEETPEGLVVFEDYNDIKLSDLWVLEKGDYIRKPEWESNVAISPGAKTYACFINNRRFGDISDKIGYKFINKGNYILYLKISIIDISSLFTDGDIENLQEYVRGPLIGNSVFKSSNEQLSIPWTYVDYSNLVQSTVTDTHGSYSDDIISSIYGPIIDNHREYEYWFTEDGSGDWIIDRLLNYGEDNPFPSDDYVGIRASELTLDSHFGFIGYQLDNSSNWSLKIELWGSDTNETGQIIEGNTIYKLATIGPIIHTNENIYGITSNRSIEFDKIKNIKYIKFELNTKYINNKPANNLNHSISFNLETTVHEINQIRTPGTKRTWGGHFFKQTKSTLGPINLATSGEGRILIQYIEGSLDGRISSKGDCIVYVKGTTGGWVKLSGLHSSYNRKKKGEEGWNIGFVDNRWNTSQVRSIIDISNSRRPTGQFTGNRDRGFIFDIREFKGGQIKLERSGNSPIVDIRLTLTQNYGLTEVDSESYVYNFRDTNPIDKTLLRYIIKSPCNDMTRLDSNHYLHKDGYYYHFDPNKDNSCSNQLVRVPEDSYSNKLLKDYGETWNILMSRQLVNINLSLNMSDTYFTRGTVDGIKYQVMVFDLPQDYIYGTELNLSLILIGSITYKVNRYSIVKQGNLYTNKITYLTYCDYSDPFVTKNPDILKYNLCINYMGDIDYYIDDPEIQGNYIKLDIHSEQDFIDNSTDSDGNPINIYVLPNKYVGVEDTIRQTQDGRVLSELNYANNYYSTKVNSYSKSIVIMVPQYDSGVDELFGATLNINYLLPNDNSIEVFSSAEENVRDPNKLYYTAVNNPTQNPNVSYRCIYRDDNSMKVESNYNVTPGGLKNVHVDINNLMVNDYSTSFELTFVSYYKTKNYNPMSRVTIWTNNGSEENPDILNNYDISNAVVRANKANNEYVIVADNTELLGNGWSYISSEGTRYQSNMGTPIMIGYCWKFTLNAKISSIDLKIVFKNNADRGSLDVRLTKLVSFNNSTERILYTGDEVRGKYWMYKPNIDIPLVDYYDNTGAGNLSLHYLKINKLNKYITFNMLKTIHPDIDQDNWLNRNGVTDRVLGSSIDPENVRILYSYIDGVATNNIVLMNYNDKSFTRFGINLISEGNTLDLALPYPTVYIRWLDTGGEPPEWELYIDRMMNYPISSESIIDIYYLPKLLENGTTKSIPYYDKYSESWFNKYLEWRYDNDIYINIIKKTNPVIIPLYITIHYNGLLVDAMNSVNNKLTDYVNSIPELFELYKLVNDLSKLNNVNYIEINNNKYDYLSIRDIEYVEFDLSNVIYKID